MNQRIRLYLNVGLVFFAIGLVLPGKGELIPFNSIIFNIMIFKMFKNPRFGYQLNGYKRLLIGCSSFITATFILILQYQYRNYIDGGCIRTISDLQAGISYMSYQVIFTIMIWEVGLYLFLNKKIQFIHNLSNSI